MDLRKLTTQEVLEASDRVDALDENFQDEIDDLMEKHFEAIADILVKKHGLSDEERERVIERLAWQVILLPG